MRDFIEIFKPVPARVLAQRELEDAQRALLKAQTGRDYAESQIAYLQRVIARLSVYLKENASAAE
jgi:hypothetical protein